MARKIPDQTSSKTITNSRTLHRSSWGIKSTYNPELLSHLLSRVATLTSFHYSPIPTSISLRLLNLVISHSLLISWWNLFP